MTSQSPQLRLLDVFEVSRASEGLVPMAQSHMPSACIGLFFEPVLLGAEQNGMYALLGLKNKPRGGSLERLFGWSRKVRAGMFTLANLRSFRGIRKARGWKAKRQGGDCRQGVGAWPSSGQHDQTQLPEASETFRFILAFQGVVKAYSHNRTDKQNCLCLTVSLL